MKNKYTKKNNYYEIELYNRFDKVSAITLIDAEDLKKAQQYQWYLGNKGYAKCNMGIRGKSLLLHRIVMDAELGTQVDHVNLNRLDNRKQNLRFVTASQQNMNKGLQKNNKTGIRGVHFRSRLIAGKQYDYYVAHISIDRKQIPLGYFKSLKEAQHARKEAEYKFFGDYRYQAV